MEKFLKSVKGKIIIAAALILLIAAAILIYFLFNSEPGYRSISISEIYGSVITENNGNTYEAYKNMRLGDGYALSTKLDSYTRMVLDDDKYVKLEELSRALFENLGNDKKRRTAIRLESGVLTTEITAPLDTDEDFVVNTPNAVLAVRGTFFRIAVSFDESGDAYTDVYTYGGTVACKRVMPDGTVVDEEVLVNSGYKARIKMDEIITVYVEELIESGSDNVDPIDVDEITESDLVDIYNASYNGHQMFLSTLELWNEITEREIDISKYHSVYDGSEIERYYDREESEDMEEDTGEEPVVQNGEPSEAVFQLPWDSDTVYISLNGEIIGSEGIYSADVSEFTDYSDEEYQNEDSGKYGSYDDRSDPGNNGGSESSQNSSGGNTGYSGGSGSAEKDTAADDSSGTAADYDESDNENDSGSDNSADYVQDNDKSGNDNDQSIANTENTGSNSGNSSSGGNTGSGSNSGTNSSGGSNSGGNNSSGGGNPGGDSSGGGNPGGDSSGGGNPGGDSSGGGNSGGDSSGGDDSEEENPGENEPGEISGIIYTDNGNIVITSTGYTQGDSGEEIPYTGDYTITQNSSTVVEASVTVESGTHNITLDGVNIYSSRDAISVSESACATLYGNAGNTLTAFSGGIFNHGSVTVANGKYDISVEENQGIDNFGTFKVIGGTIVSYSKTKYGIYNENTIEISGGSIEASGSISDICMRYDDYRFIVTGGSLRAVNGNVDGTITNKNGDELMCFVYDSLLTVEERTCKNSDGTTYIYSISMDDTAGDGKYYVWKPAEESSDEPEEPDFDGTIYMDNGSVVITETGFTQGDSGEEIPWTGDYTITQKDRSEAVEATITVQSGTHNITMDGVNIAATGNVFTISGNATVTLAGGIKENTLTGNVGAGIYNDGTLTIDTIYISSTSTHDGIYNYGTLEINSGTINVSGNSDSGIYNLGTFEINGGTINVSSSSGNGIYNPRTFEINGGIVTISSGRFGILNFHDTSTGFTYPFEINGGSVEVSGDRNDISTSDGIFTITGGSLRAVNDNVTGTITNANGDTLQCQTLTNYPGNINVNGSYTYALSETDKASDGNYYVWLPVGFEITDSEPEFDGTIYMDNGSVTITETGFTQGDSGEEIPWTGNYIITQEDSSEINATITVESGTHNITMDGVNIAADGNVFSVSAGAVVTLNGGAEENTIASHRGYGAYNNGTLYIRSGEFAFAGGEINGIFVGLYNRSGTIEISGGIVNTFGTGSYGVYNYVGTFIISGGEFNASSVSNSGIYSNGIFTISGGTVTASSVSEGGINNNGTFTISGGTVIASSESRDGFYNHISGTYEITGGNIEASGGRNDINISTDTVFLVTGGSLRAVNDKVNGPIINTNGETLQCQTLTNYPSNINVNGSYIYMLSETDKASDGNYYIWVPEGFEMAGYFSIIGEEFVLSEDELPAGDSETSSETEEIPEEDKALPPEEENDEDSPDNDGDDDPDNDNYDPDSDNDDPLEKSGYERLMSAAYPDFPNTGETGK